MWNLLCRRFSSKHWLVCACNYNYNYTHTLAYGQLHLTHWMKQAIVHNRQTVSLRYQKALGWLQQDIIWTPQGDWDGCYSGFASTSYQAKPLGYGQRLLWDNLIALARFKQRGRGSEPMEILFDLKPATAYVPAITMGTQVLHTENSLFQPLLALPTILFVARYPPNSLDYQLTDAAGRLLESTQQTGLWPKGYLHYLWSAAIQTLKRAGNDPK